MLEEKHKVIILVSIIIGLSIFGYGFLDYKYKKEALEQKTTNEEKIRDEERSIKITRQTQLENCLEDVDVKLKDFASSGGVKDKTITSEEFKILMDIFDGLKEVRGKLSEISLGRELRDLQNAIENDDDKSIQDAISIYKKDPEISDLLFRLRNLKQQYVNVDVQQLSMKLVGNSIYGILTPSFSPFYDIGIGSSITTIGQHAIRKVGRMIKDFYEEAEVIYGDTDSVFIRFNNNRTLTTTANEREELKLRGIEFSDIINKYFKTKFGNEDMHIEFEKLISPLALLSKKKYFGMYYEKSMTVPDKKIKNGTIIKKRNFSASWRLCGRKKRRNNSRRGAGARR